MAEPIPPPPPQSAYALMQLLNLVKMQAGYALGTTWKVTFQPLFEWLGAKLNFKVLGVHPLGFLAKALKHQAELLGKSYGDLSTNNEAAMTLAATYQAKTQSALGGEVQALAGDSWAAQQRLKKEFLPWFVSGRVAPLKTTIGMATTTAKAASNTAAKAQTQTRAVSKTATHTATVVAKAHVATLPQTIAHVNNRVGALERFEKGAVRDLSRLKSLAKPLAFAGLVAAALTRLGLNWIRCPQNKRFGKNLCGRPDWFLDAVLGALAFVAATEGLVPFAKQVQHGIDDAAGFAGRFWHAHNIGQGGDRQLGSSTLG